jgi:ammonium transporter
MSPYLPFTYGAPELRLLQVSCAHGEPVTTIETVDIGWLLFCAALVLLMQAGFTALESGLVRSKNSINVAIKNFANFLVTTSLFWLFGFGLMFGTGEGGLIGTSSFFFDSDGSFLTAFFLFQLGFIGTATTLMSGAVAERMRFGGYLVLATFVAAIAYPVFGHWVWGDVDISGSGGSDGWLRELGFVDFAGSTVVHSVGGWVALAAIIILGPRIGRFGTRAVPIRADYLPLTTLGVFVLWVGWYGFNGGSTFALTSEVPAVIRNTTLAAAFGGLVGLALSWRLDRRPDVVTIMNASLAGLVGITASADMMSAWKAALIGGVAAVVMQLVTRALERMQIDDAVGAVPVHLGAGIWGTLAVGLLGDVDSFPVASGRLEQIGIQLVGIGVAFVWAFGVGYLVLSLINRRFPFRIDPEGELAGLNIAEHGASTDIADLLTDMDEHRRSGDFDRPVRVEPHTEVGQIAAEYNRVLDTIGRRTDSLQLLRHTAAAANESSSVDDALALALDEVCRFTGWPIGHALLVSRDDPEELVPTGIWRISDEERYGEFRHVTESERVRSGSGLPGLALETRKAVFGSSDDLLGRPAEAVTLTVLSLESADEGSGTSVVIPLEGRRASRMSDWLELGLRAGLAVPIMAGTEAVGVLEFFADQPFVPDADLVELLLSVGTQLGRVVERQRSEEARLRALVDNMPANVYLRDLGGRFILVNRQYEDFWGLRHDEIRGKTLLEADAISDIELKPDVNARADREVLAAGEPRRSEKQIVREGKEHVLADVRFPVLDSSGRAVAVAGIDLDITAQKRSEAELAELLRRVEMARDAAMEAGSAKSRFLANMSHELRTPLNAIIGFTRLVSRNAETLPEKQVDNLSKILVSAEQLLSLIDEILDLSRVEAGRVDLDIAEVHVGDVLREVADSLEPLVDRPRVQLVVEADPRLPWIASDRDKIKQILLNLVSNAIKYTDEGSIAVRADTADGRLRVGVSDTGVGIPGDELGKIFDEFHRADSASARRRRGTGLGLTISRRLARTLGGDVTAESRLGAGSTFTLDLPLNYADGQSKPGDPEGRT